jgi:osmotically-inducible protein OsmY
MMKTMINLFSLVAVLFLSLGISLASLKVSAQDDEGDARTAGNVTAVVSRIGEELGDHQVNVTSFGGTVLLTGHIGTDEAKQRVSSAIAFANTGAYRVVNELTVGAAGSTDSAADEALKEEIISKIGVDFAEQGPAVGVVVENGTVFLMGRLARDKAMEVATMVSLIPGVQAIRMVFDFVN